MVAADGDGLVSLDDAADEAARERCGPRARRCRRRCARWRRARSTRTWWCRCRAFRHWSMACRALSREFDLPIVCFGHAGNGNLHVNLLYDPADAAQSARAHAAMARVFALTLSLGGTLVGRARHRPGQARIHAAGDRRADAGVDARGEGGVRSGRHPQSGQVVAGLEAMTSARSGSREPPSLTQPKCSYPTRRRRPAPAPSASNTCTPSPATMRPIHVTAVPACAARRAMSSSEPAGAVKHSS